MFFFQLYLLQVEQDTAQSMQMLLKIDNIKSRMKDASDALRVFFFSLLTAAKEYFRKRMLSSGNLTKNEVIRLHTTTFLLLLRL